MEKVVKFARLVNPATGNKGEWVCYDDPSDDICVYVDGMQYDSYEAYHLPAWANERNLIVEFAECLVELPN